MSNLNVLIRSLTVVTLDTVAAWISLSRGSVEVRCQWLTLDLVERVWDMLRSDALCGRGVRKDRAGVRPANTRMSDIGKTALSPSDKGDQCKRGAMLMWVGSSFIALGDDQLSRLMARLARIRCTAALPVLSPSAAARASAVGRKTAGFLPSTYSSYNIPSSSPWCPKKAGMCCPTARSCTRRLSRFVSTPFWRAALTRRADGRAGQSKISLYPWLLGCG